jgi:hypothetical protein
MKYTSLQKLLFLISVLLLSSCHRKDNSALTRIDLNGNEMFTIDPLAIRDTISVNLTDILDDIRAVKLEKTNESLIDYIGRCYVGERYIICTTVTNGILMFAPDGKFIKHIAVNGRGPGEVNDPNAEIWVDEKNDRLYIRNQMMPGGDFFCFNIQDKSYKKIPIAVPDLIRDIIVKDDSLIYLTIMPMMGNECPNPLICQTTTGRLLWKATMKNRLGATNGTIRILDNQVYFNYIWGGDTLYKFNDNKLIPFISIKYSGKLYIDQPYTKGDIFLGISPLTHSLFRGYFYEVKDVINDETRRRSEPVMGEKHHFLISPSQKKVWAMKKIGDDYFGADEMPYLRPQNNGTAFLIYTSLDIAKIAKKVSENASVGDDIRKRIAGLNNSIDESDNPVLLIGKIKK